MFKHFSVVTMLSISLLFSGCIKYHKVSHAETPQAKEHERFDLVAQKMIKSINAYNGFRTLAIFDALWLSDPTREVYSYLFAKKHGKNRSAQQALLRRQLEENKHWVSFIILAEIHGDNRFLNEEHPEWTVYLTTKAGVQVQPVEIKEVKLEPEYHWLFKHRYSPHKTSYLVKFPAHDIAGKKHTTQSGEFSLVYHAPHYSVSSRWGLADQWHSKHDTTREYMKMPKKITHTSETALKDEDFYWC